MDVAISILLLAFLLVMLWGARNYWWFLASAKHERNGAVFWWDVNFWPYRTLEKRFGQRAGIFLSRIRWARLILFSLILAPILLMFLAAAIGDLLQKFAIIPAN